MTLPNLETLAVTITLPFAQGETDDMEHSRV